MPNDYEEYGDVKFRICNICFTPFEITDFQILRSKHIGYHVTRMRQCRRCLGRRGRRKRDYDIANQAVAKASTLSDTEKVMNLLLFVCSKMRGGWSGFADRVGDIAQKGSPKQRLKLFQSLLNLFYLAEREHQNTHIHESAEQIVSRLHADGQLLPVLRKMCRQETLTLDMIDPAPFSKSS